MSTLRITQRTWDKVRHQLRSEYPLSVTTISWKTKEVLGFTVRHHQHDIHLDFYDERKRTLFLLKFSDIIEQPTRNKLEAL